MSFVCRDCSAEMRLMHNDRMLLVEVDGNRSTNDDTDRVLHAVRRTLGDAAHNVQKIPPTVTNTNTIHKILLTKSKPIDLSSLTTSINTQLAGMPDNSLHVRRAREFGSQCSHFNCPGCDICRSCALRPTMREINTTQNWLNHHGLMTARQAFSADVATITQKLTTLHDKTRTALDLYTNTEYQQALRQLHVLSLQNKDMLQTLRYWNDFEHFLDNLYKTLPRMHKLDLAQDILNDDNAVYMVIRLSNIRSEQFKTKFAGNLCYVMFSMCANHDVMHPGMITVMDTQASSKQFQRNTLIDVLVRIDCADAAALTCIYSMSFGVQSRAWMRCNVSDDAGAQKKFQWWDEEREIAEYVVPVSDARQIYNKELEAAIQEAAKNNSNQGLLILNARDKLPASVFDTDFIAVDEQKWCACPFDATFTCKVKNTEEMMQQLIRAKLDAKTQHLQPPNDELEDWVETQKQKTAEPILKLLKMDTEFVRKTYKAMVEAGIENGESTYIFQLDSAMPTEDDLVQSILLLGDKYNYGKNAAQWNEFLKRHQNIRNIFETDPEDCYLNNEKSDRTIKFVSMPRSDDVMETDKLKTTFFSECHFTQRNVSFSWKKMAFILCYDMLANVDENFDIDTISQISWFETKSKKRFKIMSVTSNVHGSVHPVAELQPVFEKFSKSCFKRQRAAFNVGLCAALVLSNKADYLHSNIEFLAVSLPSNNRKHGRIKDAVQVSVEAVEVDSSSNSSSHSESDGDSQADNNDRSSSEGESEDASAAESDVGSPIEPEDSHPAPAIPMSPSPSP